MTQAYSDTVSRILASHLQRHAQPAASASPAATPPPIVHQHFTVANEAVTLQLPAWRDYVGRILDVPVSRAQVAGGFRGEIDTYVLKDLTYLDSRTDPVGQIRTTARISTDSVRDYVFHVAVDGIAETVTDFSRQRKSAQFVPGILALDMNQPMHMHRPTRARVLAFFVPRATVEAAIPDAESIHGRVVAYTSPLTRLIFDHVTALCRSLPARSEADAEKTIRGCAHLIVAAFGKQARLAGNARAAARAAMLERVQRYVQANLHHEDLSPESILQAFGLPRPTLYRMFEHEGGLGAYIRNCRLRAAADDLLRLAHIGIGEIAYGAGFNSASDFTRAFRRAYGVSPRDFRGLPGAGDGAREMPPDGPHAPYVT
ncbi:helix-turn-helix domain-containing protein [Cupriavidus basilensis]|uniref:helix-turn-helix domain-containing protein n=1 Tax=Cupriavidus basilensis TaxID=68895 RepID=UPI0020A63133|nr:helix-turn-helix domain-containing protein [Cupriavidus basilensis]MCP3022349.1 helix-turn-helix domain-containing protein [Cupriavidus basilensis]